MNKTQCFNWPVKLICVALLPLGFLINHLSTRYPLWTERIYARQIYPIVAWIITRATGWMPFSLAEFLLYALVLYALFCLIRLAVRLIREKGMRLRRLGQALIHLLAWTGALYFAFNLFWGLNYNRLPLADIIGLEVRPAASAELMPLARYLAVQVNTLRDQVQEDAMGIMVPDGGIAGALERVSLGFDAVSVVYPEFAGVDSRPKPVAASYYLAYTNIWGIFIPFTIEANVNTRIPTPLLPSTIAHEKAHLRGFAREDEANYIAYLVCRKHPDADYRYSGALFALTYVLDALARYNQPAHQEIFKTLREGVRRDLADIRRFHARFESPAREVMTRTNDMYLKANHQEDGERSYGRMLDLMLAEYRGVLE